MIIVTGILLLAALACLAWGIYSIVQAVKAQDQLAYKQSRGEEVDVPGVSKLPWLLAAGFFALWILSFGFVEIHPGFVGVVTNLGVVQDEELPPGIHYVVPIINGITEFDTRVRKLSVEGYTAASREQQDLFLNLTLNYHVIPDEASVIVSEVGTDFESKIVMPRLLDIPKSVTDDYGTATVLNSRDEIRQKSIDLLSTALAPYGLVVDNIALENFGYSVEYNASIEERAIAEQEVETRQQELEQARVQAEQAKVVAEGKAQARIAEAQGEAEANRLLNESLTKDLIQWQAIAKLNPNVEVMLVPSGEGLILDIGNLQPEASPEETP
jgi:regulator of protease activity HflC (stomatin/prohibitin superfamily)